MATNYASSYPLLFLGTEVLDNPSFEEWNDTITPRAWTPSGAGVITQETMFTHPMGNLAVKCNGAKTLISESTYGISSFGLSGLPSWATYGGLCAVTRTLLRSGTAGSIAWGTVSTNLANVSNAWQFTFLERLLNQVTFSVWLKVPSGTANIKLLVGSPTSGYVWTTQTCPVDTTWRCFFITYTLPVGCSNIRVIIGGSSSWTSGQVLHVCRAQLEWSSSVGTYEQTTSVPGTRNMVVYSEQMDNVHWTKSGVTVVPDIIADPDSVMVADECTASGSDSFILQDVAFLDASKRSITLTCNTGNIVVFDSLMFGLIVDLNIFTTKWNAIPKFSYEERNTPYNTYKQLQADTWDLKASLGDFDSSLKIILTEAIEYLNKGHYFAMILDRNLSAPYRDEIFPYQALASQDSPKYIAGADGYTLDINSKGNLP